MTSQVKESSHILEGVGSNSTPATKRFEMQVNLACSSYLSVTL